MGLTELMSFPRERHWLGCKHGDWELRELPPVLGPELAGTAWAPVWRCAWKGKVENGNGKEKGKNAFLSFPVPLSINTLFSPFWPKS